MRRRHADNWSHPGHYLVDPYTWPWSPNGHGHGHEWPTATPLVQCQSALPFWDTTISKFDHENLWSRSSAWSKIKVTFDLQNSKVQVMVKVKPIGNIWGLEFNQYVCLSFRGNWTTFCWDIGNPIFDLNKANLRDLIAATGLVILLKFDPNHRFFRLCDLEISWMTLENNRAPLLYYIKLCASFQIHRWIETEITVQKHSIRVTIGDFLSCVTLKFDGWPWKTIGHFFYTTPSFVHHFKSIGEFKLELQSGNAQFGSKSAMFCPV